MESESERVSALPGVARVYLTTLTRRWRCDGCGDTLNRGDSIRVTITPGVGKNRVEHDPACPANSLGSRVVLAAPHLMQRVPRRT